MKIIKQDENGRIVIDGEGEIVILSRSIPGESPAVLTNFVFNIEALPNCSDLDD